jgi:transcription antitermination factor NusG
MDESLGGWPQEAAGTWFVVRTRSRQEKALAQDLRARGVAYFLPLITVTKFYSGRKAKVEAPLFPGYLFLCGSLDDAYLADRTDRVAQIIQVPDQRRLEWELRNVHAALGANATLSTFPYLRAGVRVEVREGPFRGLQGVIEDIDHRDRIIFQVQTLGQAVSMEIDGSLLDVIDDD